MKNENESVIVLELARRIELLCGRPLTDPERSGLEKTLAQNRAAFAIASADAACFAEIITPLTAARSGRRIGIAGLPSADGGVELVVRETGPRCGGGAA